MLLTFTLHNLVLSEKENLKLNKYFLSSNSSLQLRSEDKPKITKKIKEIHTSSLNKTFVKKDFHSFKTEHNKWDYKLIGRQLEDIFSMFLLKNKKEITPQTTRAIINLFIGNFESCDTDKNNFLNLEEVKSCAKKNKYFQIFNLDQIKQPPYMTKLLEDNKKWTKIHDTDSLVERLFTITDEWGNHYLNFYDFMVMRLVSFAWRKCGNIGFFTDEINFECAFNIVAKMKTLHRNTARNLYKLSMEISNFNSVRYLDLATFFMISINARMYGRINSKDDGDVTRSEFYLALDSNLLPKRYDKEVINSIYKLISHPDKSNQQLDLYTFIFMDIMLRLFKLDRKGRDENLIKYGDFLNIINDFSFPKKVIEEFYFIPYFNLTQDSYKMFLSLNLTKHFGEENFFMKFRQEETSETVYEEVVTTYSSSSSSSSQSATMNFATLQEKLDWINKNNALYSNNSYLYMLNPTLYQNFNLTFAASSVFHLMDFPSHGNVVFEEFIYFIQVAYTFKKFDKYKKGKLNVHVLYEHFKTYSGYPKLSYKIYERVDRLKSLSQDSVLNLFFTYALFRLDDIAEEYRKKDFHGTAVKEFHLYMILERIGIREFPHSLIEHCIKSLGDSNIKSSVPEYDWECAVLKAIEVVSAYLENMNNYKVVKKHNINLVHTEFNNLKKK